jgi:hypothetical protein
VSEVPSKLENKTGNSLSYDITRFCANKVPPIIKIADHVKKRGTSVKGNMPKSISNHSYESPFKIMVITHAEKTDNCEAASKHLETTGTGNHATSR